MKSTPIFKTFCTKLQDVFEFQDGRRVQSRADWAERRKELRAILERTCYGTLPPVPSENPRVRILKPAGSVNYPGVSNAALTQYANHPYSDSDFSIAFDLYTPTGESTRLALPAVICGDGCWRRITPELIETITSRGYALAVFNRCDIVPDFHVSNADRLPLRDAPVQKRFPDGDFGALAGWAWGFCRVMDALETFDFIDSGRVALVGHSRGGKASLLAGALDARFAVVCTNGSGAGGSGSWLYQAEGSEPLDRIVHAFPTWFTPEFARYAEKEETLPFDSHFLKALCAPRPLLETEGLGDLWANPAGACVTQAAAREVYRFLACPDHYTAMHFRSGTHGHWLADWVALLDYCDLCLFGKPSPWDPLYIPYRDLPEVSHRAPRKG